MRIVNTPQEKIKEIKAIAKEKSYPIDGLVITYDNVEYGKSLGMTGHHPKHSLAFKFYDDIYPTELLNVEFTMGKTGVLTPTAVFKPVEIDGTIVERASLHNLSIMKELGITRKGQIVNVYKANQIIPQIDSIEFDNIVITDDIRIEIPTVCPVCGGRLCDVKISEDICMSDNDIKSVILLKCHKCKSKIGVSMQNY